MLAEKITNLTFKIPSQLEVVFYVQYELLTLNTVIYETLLMWVMIEGRITLSW